MLFSRGGLRSGQSLLIHGIGGGVALAALQLAKVAGARVIVTSSSQKKLERARQLGADDLVDYSTAGDVATRVRELTDGRGVDLVLDTVGAATLGTSVSAVRNGGCVVVCGATTGAEGSLNIRELFWRQIVVIGSTMGSQEDFRRMLETVSARQLVPVVDSVEPLAKAEIALDRLQQAGQMGKIVLRVSDSRAVT
jgi:NADPH:quinone reductase-like Zn-dependent oxidoreductase